MTRKDYVLLASALKAVRPSGRLLAVSDYADKQWQKDVEAIADALRLDNPRFSFDTFYAACGYLDEL